MVALPTLLNPLTSLMWQACQIVLEAYHQGAEVFKKEDGSLVTTADFASEELIEAGLKSISPGILMVGEEAAEKGRAYPISSEFWLVDPLDATAAFIRKTGSFCINIGLVRNNTPVLGAIGDPLTQKVYVGGPELGLWESEAGGPLQKLQAESFPSSILPLRGIKSSAKIPPEMMDTLLKDTPVAWTYFSSALKFVRLANNTSDIYLRKAGIREWDTAAGHALLKAVGGDVLTLDNQTLSYGKPGFSTPAFIALNQRALDYFKGMGRLI